MSVTTNSSFSYCRVSDGADWFLPEFAEQRRRRPKLNVPGRHNWALLILDKVIHDLCENKDSALGLGVGVEPLPIYISEYGFREVVATEYSPAGWGASLDKMTEAYKAYPNIRIREENMLNTPSSGETYDLIWSNCSPEHVGTDEQIFDMMVGLYENNLKQGGVMAMVMEFRILGPTWMEPGICFPSQEWLKRLVTRIPVVTPVKTSFAPHIFNNTTPLWARGPSRLTTTLFLFEHPNGFLSSSICLVWKKDAPGSSVVQPPNVEHLRQCIQRGREGQEWADGRNYDQLPPASTLLSEGAPDLGLQRYLDFLDRMKQRKAKLRIGVLGQSPLVRALQQQVPPDVELVLVADGLNLEGVGSPNSELRVFANIAAAKVDGWVLGHQSYSAILVQYDILARALDGNIALPVFASKGPNDSNELIRLRDDLPTPFYRRYLDTEESIFHRIALSALEEVATKCRLVKGRVLSIGKQPTATLTLLQALEREGRTVDYCIVSSLYGMNSLEPVGRTCLDVALSPRGKPAREAPRQPHIAALDLDMLAERVRSQPYAMIFVRQALDGQEISVALEALLPNLSVGGHMVFECTSAAGGPVYQPALDLALKDRRGVYIYRTGVHQTVLTRISAD